MIELGYVHAFRGAYAKGLREGRDFDSFLMGLATGVPTAAVVAWVANSRGDEAIFTYLCVGVILFGVWNGAAFRTGFSLQTEFFLGTLGPSLLTRTPLFVILAGRVASDLTLGLVAAVGGVLTIAAIADVPLQVANAPLFAALGRVRVRHAAVPRARALAADGALAGAERVHERGAAVRRRHQRVHVRGSGAAPRPRGVHLVLADGLGDAGGGWVHQGRSLGGDRGTAGAGRAADGGVLRVRAGAACGWSSARCEISGDLAL